MESQNVNILKPIKRLSNSANNWLRIWLTRWLKSALMDVIGRRGCYNLELEGTNLRITHFYEGKRTGTLIPLRSINPVFEQQRPKGRAIFICAYISATIYLVCSMNWLFASTALGGIIALGEVIHHFVFRRFTRLVTHSGQTVLELGHEEKDDDSRRIEIEAMLRDLISAGGAPKTHLSQQVSR